MAYLNPYAGPSMAGLRIGLLGGSFNPAHEGHRSVSIYALKRLKLDKIWWLVSPQNPLKPAHQMAPLADRLRQASQKARHPKIVVSDLEDQWGTFYTVDTLKILKQRFPNTQFIWLMGADNMQQLPRWRQWSQLFELHPVAVFRRPAYAAGRHLGKAAIKFDRYWMSSHRGAQLATTPSPAWLVLDNPLNKLSATALRHRQVRLKNERHNIGRVSRGKI